MKDPPVPPPRKLKNIRQLVRCSGKSLRNAVHLEHSAKHAGTVDQNHNAEKNKIVEHNAVFRPAPHRQSFRPQPPRLPETKVHWLSSSPWSASHTFYFEKCRNIYPSNIHIIPDARFSSVLSIYSVLNQKGRLFAAHLHHIDTAVRRHTSMPKMFCVLINILQKRPHRTAMGGNEDRFVLKLWGIHKLLPEIPVRARMSLIFSPFSGRA